MKEKIQGIIQGKLASILLIFSFLPTLGNNINLFLFCYIFICILGTYFYLKQNYINGSDWLGYFLSLLTMVSILIWGNSLILLIVNIIVIGIPIFIFRLRKSNFFYEINYILTSLLYVFTPISFIYLILSIISYVERVIEYSYFSEEQFVTVIIIIFIGMTAIYTITLLFGFYKFLLRIHTSIPEVLWNLIFPIVITICLLVPDIVISFFVYNIYLGLFNDESTFSFIDRFYYSFSSHFLTPITESGQAMENKFLSHDLGLLIYIAHMVTIRVIDLTILATIGVVFYKKILK